MPEDLSNYNIDETYKGLLHANGAALLQNDLTQIYDGAGNTASLVIGRKDYGMNVYGNLSARGNFQANKITTLSISASDIIAKPIPKAFVNFIGDTRVIQSSYGIDRVESTAAGKYKIFFEDTVAEYLNSGPKPGKYNVNLSMRIGDEDGGIYTCYVSDTNTTYEYCTVYCVFYDITDSTNSIKFFHPKEVYVTVYKD